jgi:hypothetical protein
VGEVARRAPAAASAPAWVGDGVRMGGGGLGVGEVARRAPAAASAPAWVRDGPELYLPL